MAPRSPSHSLPVPSDFAFVATAYSHGWCVLAPFAWDARHAVLQRVLHLGGGASRIAFAQPGGRGTPIVWEVVAGKGVRGGLRDAERDRVDRLARRMFRLDAELSEFHALCRRRGGAFAKAARAGFGRLLRAPTLFEDVVKVLATTNTTWGGTKAMVANLVTKAGKLGAFPTPEQVATLGATRIASEARWGYRAQYLAHFSRQITEGALELGAWESWPGTTEALEREIRSVHGLGPYAAAHVLALLGRHDRIGVDTVFRAFVRKTYFARARKAPSDRRLLEVYDEWGPWRGLAYWAELWYSHRSDDF